MYELRVRLKDMEPPVWRELRVQGDTTLDELHEVLQVTMGWTNSHLYLFHRWREIWRAGPGMAEGSGLS